MRKLVQCKNRCWCFSLLAPYPPYTSSSGRPTRLILPLCLRRHDNPWIKLTSIFVGARMNIPSLPMHHPRFCPTLFDIYYSRSYKIYFLKAIRDLTERSPLGRHFFRVILQSCHWIMLFLLSLNHAILIWPRIQRCWAQRFRLYDCKNCAEICAWQSFSGLLALQIDK